MNPWLGILFIAAILGILIGGLRWFQHRYNPHPEISRKLLHVSMGLITLSFPWIFESAWPVLILLGIAVSTMLGLRRVSALKQHVGGVIHDIQRESLGDIYFPIGVALLFVLSEGDPILYSIPLLLLGLADAVAALVGIRYGHAAYTTAEGHKSAEGSVAFFTISFLCTHIPLLLFTETGRLESLLIASIIGVLAMLLEAIAWRGLDNLFIPLGSFALLSTHLTMSVPALSARLVVAVVMVVMALLWRGKTTLNDSALLGSALLAFLSWAIGGWTWLPAPISVFLLYNMLWPDAENEITADGEHDIQVVISVMMAGFIWLFLAVIYGRPELLYPYTLAYATFLTASGVAQLKYARPRFSTLRIVADCTLKSWGILFIPYLFIRGISAHTLLCVGLALIPMGLTALFFYRRYPTLQSLRADEERWLWRGGMALMASALGLIPLFLY